MDIFKKIDEFQSDDAYFSQLMSMVVLLPKDDLNDLYKLIVLAKNESKKLYIDDKELIESDIDYDSINIQMIKSK